MPLYYAAIGWPGSELTICCVLSKSALEKSVPEIFAPPRSLLQVQLRFALSLISNGSNTIHSAATLMSSFRQRNNIRGRACLVRIALLKFAFVRLESLRTARSIKTSDRSAFCAAGHRPYPSGPAQQNGCHKHKIYRRTL